MYVSTLEAPIDEYGSSHDSKYVDLTHTRRYRLLKDSKNFVVNQKSSSHNRG